MGHFLTPGKIALLCLIDLYTRSNFPNKSIVPVLSFIVRQIGSARDPTSFILTIDQIKAATVGEQSTVIGRSIFDMLLRKLWEVNSLDALKEFFDGLEAILFDTEGPERANIVRTQGTRSPLSKTSVLGCFVRRAALEYARMSFTDSVRLWEEFITYREPTLPLWKKRNLGATAMSFDINLKDIAGADILKRVVYGRLNKETLPSMLP